MSADRITEARSARYGELMTAHAKANVHVDDETGRTRVFVSLAHVRATVAQLVREFGLDSKQPPTEFLLGHVASGLSDQYGEDAIEWTEDGSAFYVTLPVGGGGK